jgi:hypothetical protein
MQFPAQHSLLQRARRVFWREPQPAGLPKVRTRLLEESAGSRGWADMGRDPLHEVIANDTYRENYRKAENYIGYHLRRYVDDPESWYSQFIPSIHRVILTGTVLADQNTPDQYQGVSADMKGKILPGKYREENNFFSEQNLGGITFVDYLAEQTNDPYFLNGSSTKSYKYGAHGVQPDRGTDGFMLFGSFHYPWAEHIKPAIENMRQEYKLALQAKDPEEVLDHVAKAYWNVRYHFFDGVNNSWMMAMVNEVLDSKGMGKLAHFSLDFATHPLQPESFAKVFKWFYYNFAEDTRNIVEANVARARSESFLSWMRQQETNIQTKADTLDFSTFPQDVRPLKN